MITKDDRTDQERETMHLAVVGTDRFMSGWGDASGGKSYAAWVTDSRKLNDLTCWVERRGDMTRVRVVDLRTYRPKCAHLHIYVRRD